ncbi:GGDEF domain-containing protein [Streptomyces sp. B1866]|uniref:GGDEF domain-containing protein n=1 Tax=Streptomyces sp. B1866 TaxID=3075431 RepID=UPI00288FE70D|nr:GGDEF domain-containing protein [Streptomyces sp. B1866]MDT3395458.1 GGDEF domain-containing protein [Streptomyces sp. B1866]
MSSNLPALASALPVAAAWSIHGWWLRRRLAAARRDPLSGLPTRAAFQRAARRPLARRRPAAVVLVDLDGFKALNDSHGHDAGDDAIRATGQRLTEWTDGLGVAARLGGDEFAAVIQVDDADQVRGELTALHQWLTSPFDHDGRQLTVGASIGAYWPPARTDLSAALRRADEAMYAAKRAGGGWRLATGPEPGEPTVNGRCAGRPGTHS